MNPSGLNEAKLYVTAKGLYKVIYNGKSLKSVDDEELELNPGWTQYNLTIQYHVFNVTQLTKARNVSFGAIVGTGWYSGYVGPSRRHSYYGNDEYLLLELHLNYKNGTKAVIISDESWSVTTGPIVYSDILHGELYYENLTLGKWLPVFTKPVNTSVSLVAEKARPTTTTDFLDVVESWSISPDVWVYDFGVNFAGYVQLTLPNFSNSTVIQVRHAEALNPNGSIYTLNLRWAIATDRYVLNGE